ncbi:conserved hypothetical protein [Talaromyces stipitatus ATCC 10500]|uniref:Major facilitator superfamily (MFS) profile domain-containing protein n=1 Tax=Talaromyces stipitatus (strain ATCC 10500 / CBS 375.48 / QM 6759 / NRRL 1006) TaxID=441959 RepID=B8MTM0_TALSN|nr:uncharacterized protein TSTA_004720 [Talaromyces stipitatus ATCC 10500]EED12426.1 conserved hypothetical protein [Talaromyces stipitatus ATCC 10500]
MASTHNIEHGPRHMVHSHAHEVDIPGTVDLNAVEGDDTGYGQALYPVPTDDPNDPLQWPEWKKSSILIICALYSFLGNCTLTGPSVYISIYAEEFGITPTKASGLVSYPNLAFGFGSLLLVPLYLKIGRRPVTLLSMACFVGGLIGASRASSYEGLMVARVFCGLGSGVCESLPVQLVNDIFYLHERGKRLGYYTICLCLGATGPLYAGYMLAGGYSWRLFFYVVLAFAGALLIAAFFLVEETNFKRPHENSTPSASIADEKLQTSAHTESVSQAGIPARKPYISTLRPWSSIDPDAQFFVTMLRSFTYFFVPAVFWVITTYGIYIGLGAFSFNYVFPIKITAPPYNWSQTNSGLLALATLVGYLLAFPFTSSSDRLAAYLTKRNGGIREAEMRLGVLLLPMLIPPAGLIVFGYTAERNLHWMGYFAGVAMDQFGSYFYFTFVLAYAVDSYNANTPEMLIAMNLGKQAISFGMSLYVLDWVMQRGYVVVISGIFCGILLANNLIVVIFMIFGKRIRRYTSRSWLGRLHARTQTKHMTH